MYKKIAEFIFFIALITIMVMSLNLAIANSTGMDIKLADMFQYTLLVVVAAAIIIRFPITLLGVLIAAIAGGAYAYAKQLVIPADVAAYFTEFISWLPNYIIGTDSFYLKYSLVFAIAYILLSTLVISLIVFSRKGYGLLIALGTGAFAFFWFIYVERARLYLFYYLFAALILYSYNVYDRKRLEWVSSESNIDKNIEIKWVFNSLIIVLISVMLSQFMVLDIKPVQWTWLSEKAIQVFPFIENWRNDNFENFSFSFGSRYGIDAAGYKTERLGGPVKLSDKVMLVVETGSTDNVYLKGAVKDFYTGVSWVKTKKGSTIYDISMTVTPPFRNDVSTYSRDLKITHVGLSTSTIFAPNTLVSVEHKMNTFTVDKDGEAYFPRVVGRKNSYQLKVTNPYINVGELRKIDTAALQVDLYKQLPENIPQRVKQLALDITAKYNNDYDKAKAIEQYLRQNYKYTLSPQELPKGAEFVDHFLFESKEGYCTYFASSAAVLMRAAGIPCRYVEGFLVKSSSSYIKNVPGTDAHAWVEVDFGPYGWLNFEATPAYPLNGFREQGAVAAAPIEEPTTNQPITPAAPIDSTGRDKNLEIEDEEGAGDVEVQKEIPWTLRIILAIIAIIVIRVLYCLLKRGYIELKIRKARGRQYSIRYFQDFMRYMKNLNVKMLKDETMREYWHKVKHQLDDVYQNGDEILSLLEKSRYSQQPMDEEEIKLLEDYRKMLKKHVTARLGRIKAFISYYIVGL